MAVVKLLHKKNDKKQIANYRPISLLTTDYKLLAKITTERMKDVLNTVIANDQQGFIKDGVITGNLILVKEVIEYCNELNEEGAVVMMDFMKAYDRVDRDVMMKVLRKMNFGEDMLNMVETLYEDVEARVEVNGEMSDVMKTGGGVRQGCPLSPYLFICVLELLAISIRKNEGIVGIREPISGVSTKFSLFADDSALLCGNPMTGLKEARKEVERFEEATAGALHDGKTKILLLGNLRGKSLKNEDFESNLKSWKKSK